MIDTQGDAGWIERRTAMAARLGVHGDFIHVPQLARALDISATTIRAQMRRGIFPMPHRKIGSVCVVKLDDYILWFDSDGRAEKIPEQAPPLPASETAGLAGVATDLPPKESAMARRAARLPNGESSAEFKARIKGEVREEMRRKGFDV